MHYDIHEFARVQEQPTDAALHPATSLDGAQQTLLLRLPPSTSGALDGGGKRYETALLALVDGPIHPLLTELLGRRPDMVYLCMFYAGAQGVISLETLRLYAALRQLGVKLVVVTGEAACRSRTQVRTVADCQHMLWCLWLRHFAFALLHHA